MKSEKPKQESGAHGRNHARQRLTTLQTQIIVIGTLLSTSIFDEVEQGKLQANHAELRRQYAVAYGEYEKLYGEFVKEFEAVVAPNLRTPTTASAEVKQIVTELSLKQMVPTATDKSIMLREGFWTDGTPDTAHLPKAVPSEPWPGQNLFLKALAYVEKCSDEHNYKGWSNCRCCGIKNGSADFYRTRLGIKFIWPCGFSHYVEKHNIRPSLAFQDWVMAQYATRKQAPKSVKPGKGMR